MKRRRPFRPARKSILSQHSRRMGQQLLGVLLAGQMAFSFTAQGEWSFPGGTEFNAVPLPHYTFTAPTGGKLLVNEEFGWIGSSLTTQSEAVLFAATGHDAGLENYGAIFHEDVAIQVAFGGGNNALISNENNGSIISNNIGIASIGSGLVEIRNKGSIGAVHTAIHLSDGDRLVINNQHNIIAEQRAILTEGQREVVLTNGSEMGDGLVESALAVEIRDAELVEIYNEADSLFSGSKEGAILIANSNTVRVENSGEIRGMDSDTQSAYGITVDNGDDIMITNYGWGEIKGDIVGVSLSGRDATLANAGTITALSGNHAVEILTTEYGRLMNGMNGLINGGVVINAAEAVAGLHSGSVITGSLTLVGDEAELGILSESTGFLSGIVQGGVDLTGTTTNVLNKLGHGTLMLDAITGLKAINMKVGGLVVTDADLVQDIDLTLEGGTFGVAEPIEVNNFNWEGGSLIFNPDNGPAIYAQNFTVSQDGVYEVIADLHPVELSGRYQIVLWDTASFDIDLFRLQLSTLPVGWTIDYGFEEVGQSLEFWYDVLTVSSPVLTNSGPEAIPTGATFIVNLGTRTGGPSDSNVINALIFESGGTLEIHNTLEVTSGGLFVGSGFAEITGDQLFVPSDLWKEGDGTLTLASGLVTTVGANILVEQGGLSIEGSVTATGGAIVSSALRVTGELSTGQAVINNGLLIINGVVTAPGLLNNNLMQGSGWIHSALYNAGLLNPGNSPGTLTVVGNYTQTSSGTLMIEVEGTSNHDRLWVTGNAHLDGTLLIGGSGYEYGDKVRFLRAGSITGEFDKIISDDGFRVRLLQKKTSLTALFAPEKYSDLARGDNHRSTARALDHFIDATSGDKETVSIALDHLRADEYANAFQQISPAFHETIGVQAVNLTQQQGRLLQQQVGKSRYGIRGMRPGYSTPVNVDINGKSILDSKSVSQIALPLPDPNLWSVWLEGNGIFSKVTQAHQVSNGKTRAGGFTLGADYAWNPNFITGLFAGYEGMETKHDDLSRTTMNGSRFGGYATYNLDSGLYFDGIAWGGVSEYKSHRRIKFGSIDRTATADQQAGEISALIGTGYDFKPGNWIMGPTASLQYTYVGIKGFEEDGAKSLNLDVDRQRIHSLRSNLGARIAYRYEAGSDLVIVPELRASWEYEFANDVRTINAQLGGKDVRYRTSSQERASLFAGAGVNAIFNNRVSTSLNYNVDVGRSNDTAHIISASFGVNW